MARLLVRKVLKVTLPPETREGEGGTEVEGANGGSVQGSPAPLPSPFDDRPTDVHPVPATT